MITRTLPVTMCLLTFALLASAVAAENLLPNPGFEEVGEKGYPAEWGHYNWGGPKSEGISVRAADTARTGDACLRAESRDGASRPGAYTRVPLKAGRHVLRFFAKTENGGNALVRCYLADRYSPPRMVGADWTEVIYEHTVAKDRLQAEINVQHFGGAPGTVLFDDVSLEPTAAVESSLDLDDRPVEQQPKLLYFSGNMNHAADTAADWVSRGFSGFFHSYIYHDWRTDVWAADGTPNTRGEGDALLAEAREALAKAREAGLGAHALKVAFYSDLPDPFDDRGYELLRTSFTEGARFAVAAGFEMFAIDTEYVSKQYELNWDGYDFDAHPRDETAARLRERWKVVGEAIAEQSPELTIGILPEGMIYYGPFWMDIFSGLLEGLKSGGSKAGVHVFCEGTYSLTDPDQVKEHAEGVRATTAARLSGDALTHWQQFGGIALGAWPLGYYRAIRDKDGEFLGWSGKEETFGSKIVGSYADKSGRYPIEDFRRQLAAVRTFSDEYCWIYGHGATWWQLTEEQADGYAKKHQQFSRENYLLKTVENIDEYYAAAAERNIIRFNGDSE